MFNHARQNGSHWQEIAVAACALLSISGCPLWESSPAPKTEGIDAVKIALDPQITVNYYRSGDLGRARIILIHGSPGKGLDWRTYLEDYFAGFETIAIDRLGYGDSLVNGEHVAITSIIEQAAAVGPLLVDARGPNGNVRKPILVGHSFGGAVAARVAADFPERVGGLVILAGAFDADLIQPHWFNYLTANPALDGLVPAEMKVSNDELFACDPELTELAEVLDQIRCPVILVYGERDWLAPPANADFAATRMTSCRLIEKKIVVGGDHFLPSRFESDVRDAIARMVELTKSGETKARQ